MSLRHVILGALSEPASGYDLKQGFDSGMRLFWSAELSQIYLELKKMEAEGLVVSHSAESTKGPRRRVYERTEAGMKVLEDWLLAGPDFGKERNAVVAQTFFLDSIPVDSQQEFLATLRENFQEKLTALNAIETRWRGEDPRVPDKLPPQELPKLFALTAGQRRMATMIDWCYECSALLSGSAHEESSEH